MRTADQARSRRFTLPGCSNWVLAQCGATGYYRVGYQPDAVRALAADAETKLSPAERISVQNDIWASVRVGREPVGDYLAFAQGLQSDRNRAVLEDVLGRLDYIERLSGSSDKDQFRIWLRQFLTPAMKEVGWEPKPGDSDEQKTLRSGCSTHWAITRAIPRPSPKRASFRIRPWQIPLGGSRSGRSRDFAGGFEWRCRILRQGHERAQEHEIAGGILRVFLHAAAVYAIPNCWSEPGVRLSPDVRSQDALQLVTSVMANPAGEKLAWDFIRQHWPKWKRREDRSPAPQVVGATSVFCDAGCATR